MVTSLPSQPFAAPPSSSFRESFASAVRFWERRRILYNLVLTAVAVFWLVRTWPHFRPAFTLQSLLLLSILAVLANVCYTAAYLVDIPLLLSDFRGSWLSRRWVLFFAGTLFAILVESYWIADEIYPDFH